MKYTIYPGSRVLFFLQANCVSWVLCLVALGLSTLHHWKFWDQKSDYRHGVCGVPIQAERQDKLSSSRATSWAFHAKMFWGFRPGPVDVQGFYQSLCMSVFPPNTLLRMSRPALHSGLTGDARGRGEKENPPWLNLVFPYLKVKFAPWGPGYTWLYMHLLRKYVDGDM